MSCASSSPATSAAGYENILRAVKKTMYQRLGKEAPQ